METISSSSGIRGSVESLIGGRNENQDSYGMAETRLGLLVVVCDGMGGGPAGKTASSIATQAIIDYISGADSSKHPGSILSDAVVAANEAVLSAVAKNPTLKGMGTTCVCILVGKKEAYIVHVGDSRCYQLRGNRVVFRTSDHSYVGEMVRRGTLTEEEARNSNYSNVITRAIGGSIEIDPEVDVVEYRPGDRFALMSDGIWGAIPETHLIKFLSKDEGPATLVSHIATNIDSLGHDNGGGHDNLTLAMIDIPGKKSNPSDETTVAASAESKVKYPSPKNPEKEPSGKKRRFLPLIIVCAAIVVAGLILGAYFIGSHNGKDIEAEKIEAKSDGQIEKTDRPAEKEAVVKKDSKSEKVTDQAAKVEEVVAVVENKKTPAGNENEYLKKAIAQLDEIRSFNPEKMSYDQTVEKRKEMHGVVLDYLQEAINKTADEKKKLKTVDLRAQIKLDQKKIINIEKGKRISTKDSEDYINKYKKYITDLINN